jgi:hypothetical protein
MFDCLALIVLITSGFEEVYMTTEPLEYLSITFSSSIEKWVLTIAIFKQKALSFELFEYFEDGNVLSLCGYVYR